MNPLELLQTPASQRFAWCLLHFVWQGSVLAAVAWVCSSGFGKSNARVRYALNVTCLLAMVVCVGVTYALADVPAEISLAERSSHQSLAAMPGPGAMPITATSVEASGPATAISPPGQTIDLRPDNASPFSINSIQWRRVLPYGMIVYWLGVAAMLVRLTIGLQGGQRLRRVSRTVDEKSILKALAAQARALGLSYVPAVAYCRRIAVPVVVGVIRPTILLPLALAANLTPEQVEMLLAHELAHIRRLDPLVNVLQRIIEALLFFHPAVWFVSYRIRIEREHCCDDLVVRGRGRAEAYASSLLTMAQGAINGPKLPEAMAVVKKTSRLRVRIRRILGLEPADSLCLRHPWLTVPLFALAGILIVAAHLQAQESSPPDTSEPRYGGGNGTPDKPYLIDTADQLDSIGANPGDWQAHFTLMTDIDLIDFQGNDFHLIGNDTQPFTGVFDGNGHTITNFTYIVTGNEEYSDETVIARIGFFRNVNGPNAVIKDLGLILEFRGGHAASSQ